MTRRLLAALVLGSALVLASCGTSTKSGDPSASPVETTCLRAPLPARHPISVCSRQTGPSSCHTTAPTRCSPSEEVVVEEVVDPALAVGTAFRIR